MHGEMHHAFTWCCSVKHCKGAVRKTLDHPKLQKGLYRHGFFRSSADCSGEGPIVCPAPLFRHLLPATVRRFTIKLIGSQRPEVEM